MRQVGSVFIAFVLSLSTVFPAFAGQVIDPVYVPDVANPEYPPAPVILFDHGHYNFHRVDARYTGFRDLLTADGYNVRAVDGAYVAYDPDTGSLLESAFDRDKGKGRVLVIANACAAGYPETSCDAAPALTAEEVEKILAWVRRGGGLFLIFDHSPFDPIENLLNSLGITIVSSGAVYMNDVTKFEFNRSAGLNANSAIVNGRAANESVDKVRVFTGSAFRLSAPVQDAVYQPMLTLQPGAVTYDGEPVDGAFMGMAIRLGAGRVYVSGEAGMFSAQLITDVSGNLSRYMGMNAPANDPDANHNAQYLRNIVHWLDGRLVDGQLDSNGPDLVVTSVTGIGAISNTTFPIAYTVCNFGNVASAANADMAVYLSQDPAIDTADHFVRYVNVPPLAARQCISREDTAYLPTGFTPGQYYTGALLDYTNHVTEAYEGNNALTGAVVTLTGVPDLVAASVSGSTSGTPGGQMTISYTVTNAGTGSAQNYFFINVYLSPDPVITSADYSVVGGIHPPLAPGASIVKSNQAATIPANIPPGTYYIGVVADSYGNYVVESNESNNAAAGNTITIDP
jgi:hypothetical protein